MSENEPRKRRAKRFLTPSQKYEIWLQLVRQEATVAEVAAAQQVDRSTIMRIKQVAKDGALSALAASKPGLRGRVHAAWDSATQPQPSFPSTRVSLTASSLHASDSLAISAFAASSS